MKTVSISRGVGRVLVPALLLLSARASADPARDVPDVPPPARDVRTEIPNLTYAYTAQGASTSSLGAQSSANSLVARGQKPSLGGGGTVWGAPIERVTLIADAQRDVIGNFAPSAAMVVRIVGAPGEGFSLGVLGKFKVEGFGVGPNHEMESEIEGGVLASYARRGWHLDLNAIGGFGTGDDGEVDAETRVRAGRDVGSLLRLGVDGQARFRLAGDRALLGNRTWDFAGGPQVLVGSSHFFGAITGGPATMGVVDKLGWTAVATIGGTTL
jgi:hypothetical protein